MGSLSKKRVFQGLLIVIIFGVMTILSSYELFLPGYKVVGITDFYFHYNRLVGLTNAVNEHVFFPKINTTFLFGWGYPTALFYGELPLYIGVFFTKIGFGTLTSYKLMCITLTFLTMLVTYLSMRFVFKKTQLSIIIAIIYSTSTFRMFDLLVRGAFGEAAAFLFLPIVFAGMYAIISDNRKNNWWILAVGMSGLLLTHLLTFVMTCAILAFVVFILYPKKYLLNRESLWALCKAALITIGLTLFYTVPMVEQLHGNKMYVNSGMRQLHYFVVGFGDLLKNSLTNEKLGSANIGLVLVALLVIRVVLRSGKMTRIGDRLVVIGLLFTISATTVLPWKFLLTETPLKLIQFPFRLLVFATFFLAMGVGVYLNELLTVTFRPKLVIVGLLLLSAGISYSYSSKIQSVHGVAYLSQNNSVRPNQIGNGREYLRVGTDIEWLKEHKGKLDYQASDVKVSNLEIDATKLSFNYHKANNASINVPRLYYPGYKAVTENGHELQVTANKHNGIRVNHVNGSGSIVVKYGGTLLQHVSAVVSLMTIVLMSLLIGYPRMRKTEK